MTAGTLDPTFGSGGIANPSGKNFHGIAYGLAVYSSAQPATAGDIVAAGWKSDKPAYDFSVVRYTPNGTPDNTFGVNGTVTTSFKSYYASGANAVMIQPDGKIVAAGTANPNTSGGTSSDFVAVRYKTNGALDATFGSKGKVVTNIAGGSTSGTADEAQAAFLQPDGKIVLAGLAMSGGPATANVALVRYNANGSLDTSFGAGGKAIMSHALIPGSYVDPSGKYGITRVNSAVLQSDGKMLVSGYTQVTNGLDTNPISYNAYEAFVLRYNANGTLDSGFGAGGAVTLPAQTVPTISLMGGAGKLALTPSGEIVMAGFNQLAELNSDGAFDTTFANGGLAPYGVGIVAVQSNGDILTASTLTGLVSRFLPNGALDTTFGAGGTETPIVGTATQLVVQADGKIDVASGFTIARLLPSEPQIGSLTSSPNPVASGTATTLTASNIADGNPNVTITQVTFYYVDVNGNQHTFGYGTQTAAGVWTLNYTVGLPTGTYTIYAQAKDSYGVVGDPIAKSLQVL